MPTLICWTTTRRLRVCLLSPCPLLPHTQDESVGSFPFSRPHADLPPKEYAELRSKCPIAQVRPLSALQSGQLPLAESPAKGPAALCCLYRQHCHGMHGTGKTF